MVLKAIAAFTESGLLRQRITNNFSWFHELDPFVCAPDGAKVASFDPS